MAKKRRAAAASGTDFRHAVGREDHGCVRIRDFIEFPDEDRTFRFRFSTTYLLWTISWRT